jgi:hypothetical protein
MLVAVLAAGEVRQRTVQRLVGEHELRLVHRQAIDIVGVVVKGARVSGHGLAPLRVGLHHRQAQHQRPEKRLVQDQLGARGTQFRFAIR